MAEALEESMSFKAWDRMSCIKNRQNDIVVGHIMRNIEILNLPPKQEEAFKTSIKEILWDSSNDFCSSIWDAQVLEKGNVPQGNDRT